MMLFFVVGVLLCCCFGVVVGMLDVGLYLLSMRCCGRCFVVGVVVSLLL